ncbi:MAG: class I SAM-dependent methyltransferase, partial [Phycisphaerae bacterium]
MVPLTASGLAALLIPPAYHLAERSPLQTTNFARGPLQGLLRGLSGTASARARRAFEAARALPVGDGPQTRAQGRACLPADQIEPLHRCYAGRRTRSDRRSPDAKAAERAGSLLKTVRRGLPGRRAVELACGTGQVAGHVARAGLRVTAVDLVAPSGVPEGVTFHQADAAKLPLPDANADLVWTFDAFEHFDDPQAVLDEAWRVLAPGGLLYANFGPLWNSAMGPHQWGRIEIPYLQHLFAATDLDAAADRL